MRNSKIIRFVLYSITTVAVFLATVYVFVRCISPNVDHERQVIRDKLDPLVTRHAEVAEVRRILGRQEPYLSEPEARRLARTLALDKERTLRKIGTYPRVQLYCVTSEVTCFVFFDEHERLGDYELGSQ